MRPRLVLIAVLLPLLAGCAPPTRPAADVHKGRQVFQSGCAVCHYPDRQEAKVGPGLQGMFRSATLPNGQPLTDETVRQWIQNGSGQMPAFGNSLSDQQMNDLIGYLKTL